MSSQISSRLGSEIIELTAEGWCKSFFVHKNLLAVQSVFLRSTIDTAVAADRKIDLQAWDGETVGHFVDFIYLQTYEVRKPEPLFPIVGSSEGPFPSVMDTRSGFKIPERRVLEPRVQQDDSRSLTDPRPLTPLSAFRQSEDDKRERVGFGSTRVEDEHRYSVLYPPETHDYRDFLLAHARVYALAYSLGMKPLQNIAYNRLLAILADFEPITPCSGVALNFVELLHYVYTKSGAPGDPMRKLVSQFTALNFPVLQLTGGLVELVRQGGELAVDLMEKVCRRLVASEGKPIGAGERFAALDNKPTSASERLAALKDKSSESFAALEGKTGASETFESSEDMFYGLFD